MKQKKFKCEIGDYRLKLEDFIPVTGMENYEKRVNRGTCSFIGWTAESEQKYLAPRMAFLAFYHLALISGVVYSIYKGIEALVN